MLRRRRRGIGGEKALKFRAWIRSSSSNSNAMENQTKNTTHDHEKAHYVHYNHNDSCKYSRWTTRESYEFMYARPWEQVSDFYSNLVHGRLSLNSLFGIERHVSTETSIQDSEDVLKACAEMKSANALTVCKAGRWARATFKIVLSYHGGSFDGWQKQPGLNTVQGLVEKSLGRFVDEKKAHQLKEKSLPLEGHAFVAGRTDKGVTALQQVCSFYTWRKDVKCSEIEDAINNAAPEKLKVVSVSEVSRVFHPNFSAKWRRYLYIFPLKVDGNDEFDSRKKPSSFSVTKVNQLLQQLEGKSLSYKMFARDTKASRSSGPPTECFLYHARAAETIFPCAVEAHTELRVMFVELVANRFLRRMVRVLVATAVREAAAGAESDALLKLMDATCRRATAPPAPPDGLCLVDVGYQEFKHKNCLIP
ncbi:hypothetical protein MRB53_013073 [Persea americana]|uniref:Uncharacterized protein n=1 Tax=Persea americana TaxID=3435 RepID=A0ACC2K717_PERAE|nr:hypothetical protein MRB53_013073 [Persea americana]